MKERLHLRRVLKCTGILVTTGAVAVSSQPSHPNTAPAPAAPGVSRPVPERSSHVATKTAPRVKRPLAPLYPNGGAYEEAYRVAKLARTGKLTAAEADLQSISGPKARRMAQQVIWWSIAEKADRATLFGRLEKIDPYNERLSPASAKLKAVLRESEALDLADAACFAHQEVQRPLARKWFLAKLIQIDPTETRVIHDVDWVTRRTIPYVNDESARAICGDIEMRSMAAGAVLTNHADAAYQLIFRHTLEADRAYEKH